MSADSKPTVSTCEAIVSERPHYIYRHACPKPVKEVIEGVSVCGVHARVMRRWMEHGVDYAKLMIGLDR